MRALTAALTIPLTLGLGLLGAGMLGSLAGCQSSSGKVAVPPPPLITYAPVAAADAAAIANDLVATLRACTPARLAALLDIEAMAIRAGHGARPASGNGSGSGSAIDIEARVTTARDQTAREVCNRTRDAEVTLLPDRTPRPRPLLRLAFADGTFNYLELEEARRSSDSAVRVVDVTSYATGEAASTTYARLYGDSAASRTPEGRRGRAAISEAQRRLGNQDISGARATFRTIPDDVRRDKAVRVLDMQIAMYESDDAHRAALAAFQRDFPEDPALDLHELDAMALRADYAGALVVLERLDRRVGGDPFLQAMRALMLAGAGKPVEAEAAARLATTAEPTSSAGWQVRCHLVLARRDFTALAGLLTESASRRGAPLDLRRLRGAAGWAEFVTSAAGAPWALAGTTPAPPSP